MNLMNLIGLIRANHDQCFFDLWRCQQPILDVLLVFASTASLQKNINKCCQEADANPQATTLGYIATGQADQAGCCTVLHLLEHLGQRSSYRFPKYGSRLRVVFHQRGKGNSVGTNPRSHPLVGNMQTK